ncbi:hypothetical protein ACP70R_021255 [Stipagrostis hirtigluma subsp. patula]
MDPIRRRGRRRCARALRHRRGHVLHIEGYSLPHQGAAPHRPLRRAPPFHRVGGHSWQLTYYPNNEIREFADFICVAVERLRESEPGRGSVHARVTLSLLDHAGEPVPSHTKAAALQYFSEVAGIAFHDFVDRTWLEESEHLRDDRFAIRCDVVVPLEVR